MKALLLTVVVCLHPIIANGASFSLEPASVTQAEGVVARFFCRHPQTIAFGWMINGTALTLIDPRPPEIKDGSALLSDGMGGVVSTEALNITALPNYNATEVVCFAILSNGTKDLSSPAILTVQGPIDGLGVLTTNLEMPEVILLSWMPPFSLDLTAVDPDIAYCVDVYNITDGGLLHISSNCNILSPSYTFSVENPDPRNEFEFTVTPRSNVEGARNGTRSQITGRFSLQRPLVNGMPIANMLISVFNNTVDINIEFTNAAISRAPIRRPENYSVAIQIISPPSNIITQCPTIINFETESSTSLSLNCTNQLQPEQLGLVTIIASNRAGNTIILENQELSTHYIQNIIVTPGDSPGEATVSCDFINGTDAMGYLAIASGDLTVGYLVAERRIQVGNQLDTITNLASSEYGTSIFAINQTGLPEMFSSSLPRNVIITGSGTQTINGGQPSTSINVSEVQTTNVGEVCYDCTFLDSDVHMDSTCVAIGHPCGISSLYPGLFDISVTKFTRSGSSARGCIDISQCREGYYIAVLYFNGQRGMIEGLPLAKLSPNKDVDVVASGGSADVTVPVVVTLLFILIIVALVIGIIVFVWKKEMFMRRSYKPRHSPEPAADHTDYDDPSCTISTQDLVDDPEPIYHKPVESPKRSASAECHYAETTVTTSASNPQLFNPPPKTEYADVRGYKNQEEQQYALLHNQTPSKEGTPDDIHKVEYSEVNTSTEITQESTKSHDHDEDSDYEDFSAVTVQDASIFTKSTNNTDFDALGSFLTEVQINPEDHEYSY